MHGAHRAPRTFPETFPKTCTRPFQAGISSKIPHLGGLRASILGLSRLLGLAPAPLGRLPSNATLRVLAGHLARNPCGMLRLLEAHDALAKNGILTASINL